MDSSVGHKFGGLNVWTTYTGDLFIKVKACVEPAAYFVKSFRQCLSK